MGLFIGASILTILELFDYIYEVRFGIARGELTTCRCPSPAPVSRTKACGRGQPPSARTCLLFPVHGYCLSPSPGPRGGADESETEATVLQGRAMGFLHCQGGKGREEMRRRR